MRSGKHKARDQGRREFEELAMKDLVKHLGDKIECPSCEYNDPGCEGPRVENVDVEAGSILWGCSQRVCPCCDTDMDIDEFKTDMEGKVINEI